MGRIDLAMIKRTSEEFFASAEGVCAITLNKNEPIECSTAQAVNRPFLAVRKCRTSIKSTTISVNLENTNLAWSPNLHLRLLQLWVESADFRNIFSEKEAESVIDGRKCHKFFIANIIMIFSIEYI